LRALLAPARFDAVNMVEGNLTLDGVEWWAMVLTNFAWGMGRVMSRVLLW
jgi:hypothetical protein